MQRLACLIAILSLSACKPSPPEEAPTGASDQATGKVSSAAAGATVLPSTYKLSGPYTHANLSVFLIHKPGVAKDSVDYLTLEEALKAKTLNVTEKSDGAQVNRIEVENAGDQPVYLQAGDTVKGGKQDRTIAVDFVLPSKSGKREIDAFCVEPGRWAQRASAGGVSTLAAAFEPAEAPVATKEQKLAVKLEKSQDKVWEEGRKANAELIAKSAAARVSSAGITGVFDSFVLATEDPAVQKKTSEYTDALGRIAEGKVDAVGMAFAVYGEPSTAEIYSGPGLFKKLWPKLVKGAALEALSKKSDKPPTKQVTEEDIRMLMAQASDGKTARRELSPDVAMETVDGTRSATFETKVRGEFLHRQVVSK